MMTRRGTRAAAPVRLTGAFVLVGVGASVVCVATGSWDGVRVGSADRAVGASDAVGSAAAQPAVSSATISSATILTAVRLAPLDTCRCVGADAMVATQCLRSPAQGGMAPLICAPNIRISADPDVHGRRIRGEVKQPRP
jgi:hypothetical protein